MKTEFNEAEAIRLTSIARPSVKNDPISMFASDEDLLIYEHFFINGMQHSKQVTMDSKNIQRYKVNVLHNGKERFKYARTIKRARLLQQVATDGGLNSIILQRKEDGKYYAIESNEKPKLIKVTLEFDNGHKLVRSKEYALPFIINLAKEMSKKSQ